MLLCLGLLRQHLPLRCRVVPASCFLMVKCATRQQSSAENNLRHRQSMLHRPHERFLLLLMHASKPSSIRKTTLQCFQSRLSRLLADQQPLHLVHKPWTNSTSRETQGKCAQWQFISVVTHVEQACPRCHSCHENRHFHFQCCCCIPMVHTSMGPSPLP